ncbi:MAG: hypothetical protein OK452_01115 [Thaumarchaeota archaeon]|nr:hypothetical protein [Nitrososphaerota archaeon]
MMPKPSRPTGVTILAILDFVGGVLAFFVGLFVVALGGSGLLSQFGYGFVSGFVVVAGVAVIIIGLLGLLLGWGMWTGKEWAWILAIVLYALGALSSLLSLAGGSLGSIVSLVIYGLLLWYLWKPHVKAYFGKGMGMQSAPTSQPAPPPTP